MLNPYVPRPIDRPAEVPLDHSADLSVLDEGKIFAAPNDPADWPAWRDQLTRWREQAVRRIGYDDSRYNDEPVDCFVVDLAWLWDERLYDHDAGRFTVDAYVEAAARDFGGFDGVLLWHAYPIEGIDERNQFDFYYGVPELPSVVAQLQATAFECSLSSIRGSRPSRRACGRPRGLDRRQRRVRRQFERRAPRRVRAALDKLRPGLTLEAESRVPLARINDHTMSWAQWFADSPVPGVLRAKWFERRHMLHHVRRWNRNHIDELQSAWLNGTGIMVWESVFGVWVGWSARDRSMLRSMRAVQCEYAAWLRSEYWTPLADHAGGSVYASRWEHDGIPLWTVVNRGDDHDGPWLLASQPAGLHWAELTSGTQLRVETTDDGRVLVSGRLPAGALAAVVATPVAAPVMPPIERDGDASFPARAAVRVPGPGGRPTRATGRRRGCRRRPLRLGRPPPGSGDWPVRRAPYVDEWKPLPPRLHHTGRLHRSVYLSRFAIGQPEVSNAEYAAFLDATGYRPRRAERFLAQAR